MTLLLNPTTNQLIQAQPQLWQISVERYHEMIEAGLLTEDDRLELLEGYMVEKMTVNPPHAFVTETIREAIAAIIPDLFFVSSQQPVTMPDSEPEPDVLVVKGKRRNFIQRHPMPEEVALLVEVADSTIHQDQNWKKRIYGRAGIAVYWIVNLPERQIEVYTQPSGPTAQPTYHHMVTYRETDEIPVVLSGEQVALLPVINLLP
ncbi:MAG TPA: Uma2 family endonuclease [Chloroflexota bacterium]|nr:Uma2 family endonuclease [Chloroflexota bacterium]HUM70543.1 Uma2 family endonuclease [Chloroflexota bacterium]